MATVALALALLAGVGFSAQSFINGRLTTSLGSAELAGTVSNLVATTALVLVSLGLRALPEIRRRLRAGARPRWWHVAVCLSAGLPLIIAAKAAPELGVALLTVSLVCGQTIGSLVIDRVGMSPAGRRDLTPARVLGVALAIVAVVIAALGSSEDLDVGLVALVALGGLGIALQQAALGHLAELTGDAVSGSAILALISLVVAIPLTIALAGVDAPLGWSAPGWHWIGGLIGACLIVILTRTVSVLGVLRLTLALVAGQAVGALVLDAVAPVAGASVTAQTVVGVILTFAAVIVTGLGRPGRPAEPATATS